MIPKFPKFPKFKNLELEDKQHIEEYYFGSFIPSDYHFASLWGWDLNNDLQISDLNNNLVVKFKDYQTSDKFFSFFGKNKIEETIRSLLKFANDNNFPPEISLLPEQNFSEEDMEALSERFNIKEDENNFDYIFLVNDLLTYPGKNLYQKRKQLNKFLLQFGGKFKVVILETLNTGAQKDIILLVEKWSKERFGKKDINDMEVAALKKSIFAPNIKFYFFCLYIDVELQGLSIYETFGNQAIHSFQKANLSFPGITEFINHKVAEHLNSLGIKYINAEQDLGIEGLRRAKRAYNPSFLKKYSVSKKLTN